MKKKLLLFCIFFSFSLLLKLNAQTFRYTQYTTLNDLPSDNVYCAAQDNHGFMYFGTDFGLVKYDGYRFTHYSNKEGLINKPVTDMVFAGGDSIIFAGYPDALQTIHANGKIDTIINKMELGFSIQQIIMYNNSFYLYQREFPDYAILQGNKLSKQRLDNLTGVAGLEINCITPFNNKQLAFCTNKGLFITDHGNVIRFLTGQPVYRAVLNHKSELIIATDKNIWTIDQSLKIKLLPYQLPAGFKTLHMEKDNGGAVWFRGLDKGIYRLTETGITDMSIRLRMENRAINEFYNDNNSNLWLCTSGGGILFIPKNQALIYGSEEGLINNKIQRLLAVDDQLIIGTENGLSVKKGNKIISTALPRLRAGLQYVYRLFNAAPGITGLCINNVSAFDQDPNKVTSIIKDIISGDKRFRLFNGMFAWQENDSIAWMHEGRGNPLLKISIFNNKKTAFQVTSSGVRKIFDMLFFDDSYWLGSDKGIIRIKNNMPVLIDTINGERIRQVMDLMVDSKKQLWLATEVGLFKYSNNQFTSMPKAASNGGNYCTSLTEDDKGNIWAGTWDGIFSINGTKRNYYNNTSGLASRIVNSILYDKADNKLYVGTDNGLTVLDRSPEAVSFSQPVFINASLSNDIIRTVSDGTVLKPSQNDLGFYLSVPYYEGHEDISYEYKLDSNEWAEQRSPQLNISNISGGNHILKVRALINSLSLTGAESIFNFQIKIPFYQKWWFIIASLLLIQFIIILVINNVNKKRKEKKVRQQLQQQQQMLEQASLKQQAFAAQMNPHFIFNALNSVQHFINQQDRQNANRYLSDFASLIRKNFDASQQTFISLEAEQENLRLYLQLEKMRFGDKISFNITTDENLDTDNWMLPTMILQPFLENAILHGLMPAPYNGELHIHFAQDLQHELIITIADNGIGIEKSKLQKIGKDHKSKGMQMIRERLELFGKLSGHPITLTIEDQFSGKENPGTIITLHYPEEVYDNYMKMQQ